VLAGEEQREQNHRAEVGDRRGGDHQLTEVRACLARVLEHGHDDPERGRNENDRDEQGCVHLAARGEAERDPDSDRERDDEAACGEPELPPAQTREVDL
jgi:hypothetical protein